MGKVDTGSAVAGATLAASSAAIFGQYSLIAVAAVLGAFVSVSRAGLASWWGSISLFLRSVFIAVLFTTFVSKLVAEWTGYEVADLIWIVAGLIALIGDDWFRLKDAAINRAVTLIGRFKE